MKTPKLKSNTARSVRSRAGRREASPGLDVDKSITSLPRAERTSTSKPFILSVQHSSAVSKKKQKRPTRAQRLRQEKGLERAEVVMDKTEKKVAKSIQRGKLTKARKATWDDLNNKRRTNAYKILQDQAVESMDTSEKGQLEEPKTVGSSAPSVLPALPAQNDKFEHELDGEIT
ncbi:hypothetical protein PRK78_006507 [Emydomyces testavorans]|uniref:Alb1-domain-containing protein n=1 Tax=Emydomyces testavorans TaxID=2070801 RepID=A0AAF0IKW2_9EURO|nr:hypothetical protein PRK78_006507 [Emydomyces testavorans]